MQTLTLNDGTVLQNSHVLRDRNILWFYLQEITFAGAFELMANAEKTARIEQDAYGSVTAFEGYTDLFCLRREDDGMITGGLYKTEE